MSSFELYVQLLKTLYIVSDTYCGDRAVRWLRDHRWIKNILGRQSAANINSQILRWLNHRQQPFFIAVNYFDAHDPYFPPEPFAHKYMKWKRPQGLTSEEFNIYPTLSPSQIQDEMNAYDASIEYLDSEIEDLLEALEKRGLTQNTIIVFTSDHGEAFNAHGFMHHANALYRDVIQVPLVFWWPHKISGGVRITRPVSTAALAATLLKLADPRAPEIFPGPSLQKLWEGSGGSDREFPTSELSSWPILHVFPNFDGPLRSIVTPEWHYIESTRLGRELFSWKNDPLEQHNLAKTPEGIVVCDLLAEDLQARAPWPPQSGKKK